MDNPVESQPSKARQKAGMRGWVPITIIILAVIGIILIRRSPDEETMRNMHSFMVGGIAILLLLVWFLLLSRLRWWMRLGGLALLALVVVGVKKMVRIDGTYSGSGQLRLAWKWVVT